VKTYGGLIKHFALNKWWDKISDDDRNFIRNCSADYKNIDNPKVTTYHFSQSASSFLNNMATWAINAKRYDFAIEILNETLKRDSDKAGLHSIYNNLIDLCYKRRTENNIWLDKCIEYCKKDIKIFPIFKNTYIENQREFLKQLANNKFTSLKEREQLLIEAANPRFDLRIPSFERLCIIYEKQKEYQKALETCELALSYGLSDNTKGGFSGRIERIKKKIIISKE
jgi:tetratricopeptide (TPR) repeat protein